jgi:hypothetical protein
MTNLEVMISICIIAKSELAAAVWFSNPKIILP